MRSALRIKQRQSGRVRQTKKPARLLIGVQQHDRVDESITRRLEFMDEVPSVITVARCLTTDVEKLFLHQNAPLLHSTLAVVGESFVVPLQAQRRTNFVERRRRGSCAVGDAERFDPLDLPELAPIRRAVAVKARMNLPALGDAFPWLMQSEATAKGSIALDNNNINQTDTLDGLHTVAPSVLPLTLDPVLFTTEPPSRWEGLLSAVPLSHRNTHSDWMDVLHAIANNAAWSSADGIAAAHKALLSLVGSAYKAAACSTDTCAQVVPYSEAEGLFARDDLPPNGDRSQGQQQRRRPASRVGGGNRSKVEGALPAQQGAPHSILASALSPQWLRKMRGHYLKMHRVDLFSALYKQCVAVEEAIASRQTGMPGAYNNNINAKSSAAESNALQSSSQAGAMMVPSLVADDEHLGFFTVLHGRREAQGSKESRWTLVLDALAWSLPRAVVPSPLRSGADRVAEIFGLTANVAAFIHNDGNEDRRMRQLIATCCGSGALDGERLVLLLDAIEASLVKKIVVTKGGAVPAVLRALGPLLTIRHKLKTLPSSGTASTQAMLQLVPLLHRRGGSDGVAPPQRAKSPSDEVLDMPAPIVRNPVDHVAFMAKAVGGVVGALVQIFAQNKSLATASADTLVRWMGQQVKDCTPLADWRHAHALVDAFMPIQRLASVVDLLGLAKEGIALDLDAVAIQWECGCGVANTLLSRSCWACAAMKRPSPCGSCGGTMATARPSSSASLPIEGMPCPSCRAEHPRTAALAKARRWQCSCGVYNADGTVACTACSLVNPLFETHSCGHCGNETFGHKEAMCTVCGEASSGMDAALGLCHGCGALYVLGAHSGCPRCSMAMSKGMRHHESAGVRKRGTTAVVGAGGGRGGATSQPSEVSSVPHFTWKCGCGAQNSPLVHQCRSCGAGAAVAAPSASIGYICPSCPASSRTSATAVRRRIIPTLPTVVPFECKGCDALHPRDAALLAKRSTVCPSCHAVVPCGKGRCDGCGGAINTSATRFMPAFAHLPWHCHSCGTRNAIVTEDAESALRCVACDVDRVSPLLFSEVSSWDCARCGTQRNYGFACRTCEHTSDSVPDAEVTMWRCTMCRATTPSWHAECKSCGAPNARATSCDESLKYVPWQCDGCRHFNGASREKSCAKCGEHRPPVAACAYCHGHHLAVACPSGTAAERRVGLESILLEAAREGSLLAEGKRLVTDSSLPFSAVGGGTEAAGSTSLSAAEALGLGDIMSAFDDPFGDGSDTPFMF